MRRSAALLAAACLLGGAACEQGGEKTGGDEAADPARADPAKADPSATAAAGAAAGSVDGVALAEKIGVEPGPIEYDADEGGVAALAATSGKVEVRRVGTETWEEARAEAQLHEGDQVRTGDGAAATLTLVDETSVELAEESAVAVGTRKATQDPASSAAALYGVARFSVAPRAAGEGPFLVFTPGGVVATKGTVYTVGVVASGHTRIGVEDGEVEVAGSAKLDAPVALGAGKVVVIDPEGALGGAEPIGDGDWGAWRDGAEADVDVRAAAEFHTRRAAELEAELEAAYAELEVQTAAAAEAEARAEEAEQANDLAAYEAAAPEVGGAVDASFAASLRLQYLTAALMSDAYVADALYVRHPDVVTVIEPARPRLAGAILWQKKYHAVADLHVQPLRGWYYVHHPVGRERARLVDYTIPPFYARARLSYRPPAVRGRVKFAVYQPPILRPTARVSRRVHVHRPPIRWYAGVKARVRPAPARVRWYVRPKAPRARVVFGARPEASVRVKTVFRAAPPRPRAKAVVKWGGRVDVRDHRRDAPRVEVRDHRGGVDVRGGVRVRGGAAPPAIEVRDHRGRVDVRGGVGVRVRGGAAPPAVEVRDHRRGGARGDARVKIKAGADVRGGDGRARAGARVKVKAPKPPRVKVRPPKAKASIKVKGGVRIGD